MTRRNDIYGYLDHRIGKLCDEHGIVRYIYRDREADTLGRRAICHQPIEEEAAYFIALQQIGKLLIDDPRLSRLEHQARAWIWALDNAVLIPHYTTRQRICSLLVRDLFQEHQPGDKLPDKESPIWPIIRWWESSDEDARA